MGVFFSSHQPVVPEVSNAIRVALAVDPKGVPDVEKEAAARTLELIRATSPQFNPIRFFGAVVIAALLLGAAVWTEQHNLHEISKDLMGAFTGFSGLVLGLLGGEAQKFSSA